MGFRSDPQLRRSSERVGAFQNIAQCVDSHLARGCCMLQPQLFAPSRGKPQVGPVRAM